MSKTFARCKNTFAVVSFDAVMIIVRSFDAWMSLICLLWSNTRFKRSPV